MKKTSGGTTVFIVVLIVAAVIAHSFIAGHFSSADYLYEHSLTVAPKIFSVVWIIVPGIIIALLSWIKKVNTGNTAIIYTLGVANKHPREAGIFLLMPFVQEMYEVDTRDKRVVLEGQRVLDREALPLEIGVTVLYKVADAVKLITEVEDYENALEKLTDAVMRDNVDNWTLKELSVPVNQKTLKQAVTEEIQSVVNQWGITISQVYISDIKPGQEVAHSIAQVAEARRSAEARQIEATGEVKAAEEIAKAAQLLAATPGGMQLRTLQVLEKLGHQGNVSTFILPPTYNAAPNDLTSLIVAGAANNAAPAPSPADETGE
jgi:regulator of protease activity HflC (stomatin/prohibitin superfamily)